jgi:hypothetical protein
MSSLFVSDNNWHFLVMTYDGSNSGNGLQLYVDGMIISAGTKRGNPLTMRNSDPALIGSQKGNINFFNGSIDDIRIYDRVLNTSEILTLYNISE